MRFVLTRQDDLRELLQPVTNDAGIPIQDKMHFMNGDNPAIQMEDGTQHGGKYCCVGCDGNINSSNDFEYMIQRKYLSLQQKTDLILEENKHPYKDLRKNEIVQKREAQ